MSQNNRIQTAPTSGNNGHRARLRQRFARSGFSGFAEHEVVEILLTLVIPRRDVKLPAKELLQRFGNLRGIFNASPRELQETPGIGEVAAQAFSIIAEARNLSLQQEAEVGTKLNSVDSLIAFWESRLTGLRNEVFEVAFLDTAHRLVRDGVQRLETGTINRTAVYPRKVMEFALRFGAAGIVLAHNHPAAAPDPSPQDLHLTKAIAEAASALEIQLLDHLIFARDGVYSFRRAGTLPAV